MHGGLMMVLLCDRYRHELDTRPLVMWIGPTHRDAQRTARLADEQLITRWQVKGTDGANAYYPAREHIVFVDEHDLLAGSLRGWMVPPRPAATGTGDRPLIEVDVINPGVLRRS